MTWGQPELLPLVWLLLPIAAVVAAVTRQKRGRLARIAESSALARLAPHLNQSRIGLRTAIWLVAIGICLLSLARPQWGERWEEVRRTGLDVIVALDTSKSMLAQDLKPSRLEQAKWGLRDLAQRLRGDRIGLVSFAGSSFLQCPLTSDYGAFMMTLDDVFVGIIPRGGTAIADSLKTAIKNFDPDSPADQVIMLITDGEDHEGDPLSLLPELKKKGIRVLSIGIGSDEGDLIPVSEGRGNVGYLKDREGNVVKSTLQEDVLQRLALETGGAYVRAAPGDLGMERIVEEGFARLERSEADSRLRKAHKDRFAWFVGVALILLAIEAILSQGFPLRKGAAA